MSKNPKKSNFRAPQTVEMAVFEASKWPKLISCKIFVAQKSWHFHIVDFQLGCPGLCVQQPKIVPLNPPNWLSK